MSSLTQIRTCKRDETQPKAKKKALKDCLIVFSLFSFWVCSNTKAKEWVPVNLTLQALMLSQGYLDISKHQIHPRKEINIATLHKAEVIDLR